jgi:hypothetical protein
MIARLQMLYRTAYLQNEASTLVTEHYRARHGQATTGMRTHIRMTHTRCHHAHQHLIGTRRT